MTAVTWDGIFQFVPNSELWNKRLINYSRLPTRLVDLQFGIAYDNSIGKGRDVLLRIASSDDRVHKDPEPQVFVAELGDSAVVLGLRVRLVLLSPSLSATCTTAASPRWKAIGRRVGTALPLRTINNSGADTMTTTCVEDVLRAVAMVIVDVEQGNLACSRQMVRRYRRVVRSKMRRNRII